jgi:hypothetical protein
MVPFARIAQGLVTGLGPRAVTDGASGKLMKALAPELSASAAEVDGGMFAALFPAGSAHGANATQGGNFHGVFEASPLGPKGGQKPRAHRIPSLRESRNRKLSG